MCKSLAGKYIMAVIAPLVLVLCPQPFLSLRVTADDPPAPAPFSSPSFEYAMYTNDSYGFSVKYPAAWASEPSTIPGVVFYAEGTGKDDVFIAVRPATNFTDAATTFLADAFAASAASFTPAVDSVSIVTLSDGVTQANNILFSAFSGTAKAAVTGVIKDGNAIMIMGASDPAHVGLYQEIGETLTVNLTPIPASVTTNSINFTASESLACPTDSSVTVRLVAEEDIEAYFEYGIAPEVYTGQTSPALFTGGTSIEVVIGGLLPNTHYYYRMQYRQPGDADWTARDEHSFWTQRSRNSTFAFTVTSDSHVNIRLGSSTTWQQTLSNVANDYPDFLIDLGDTFAMDNVTSVAGAEAAYLYQRDFFDIVGHSASIFLATGNHEQEEGWHLDDTGNPATSPPVLGANARKKYFPNPVPNAFYTGNTEPYSFLDGDQLLEDYYAWTWGDALFVVIDPYWYTAIKPYVGNEGGGERSDAGSGDRWDWTLGQAQFNWFKQTLENSEARYKFVFAHHMVGGSADYVRGGAVPAHICEWGGYSENGTTWEWDTKRAGWGSQPVHQFMVANGVSAFFHGHDHQYAYEVRDGIVYQSLPAAGFPGNGFNIYNESNPYTERVLPSPGHLRVTVSPSQATVDYVATSSGTINYSYAILAAPTTLPIVLTDDVTSVEASSAVLNGTLNRGGGEACQYRFCRGTSSGIYTDNTTWSTDNITTAQPFSAAISGLSPNTTYYYVAECKNSAGIGTGLEKSFTTMVALPAVTNAYGTTSIMANTAILNGNLTSDGGDETTVHICGGTTEHGITPADWDFDENLGVRAAGRFSLGITGLTPSTTYFYRCYATNSAGPSWALSSSSFTTQPDLGLWRNYWAGPGKDWFWFSSGGP